ncbi:DedA family protein [bacterium]|nr:DedA family protein [bacterium]
MAEEFLGQYGYFGIILLLVLGGLGLPVPEEAPVILAAILSKRGIMFTPLAFGACVIGVLLGDFVVYFLGFFYGERVMNLSLARKFLTVERETQMKGYFHRHGIKILILGRFAVGFRTAAYLTAGILRIPPVKLLLTDLVAVALSTPLMFGLGYVFAHQIERGLHEAQRFLTVIIMAGCIIVALVRWRKGRREGRLPVGPPIPVGQAAPASHSQILGIENGETPVESSIADTVAQSVPPSDSPVFSQVDVAGAIPANAVVVPDLKSKD